jgi:hypothetical protein
MFVACPIGKSELALAQNVQGHCDGVEKYDFDPITDSDDCTKTHERAFFGVTV